MAGLGLSITRQRLHNVYGDRPWLEAGPAANGYLYELSIPAARIQAAVAAE